MNLSPGTEIERSLFEPWATQSDVERLCALAIAKADTAICVTPLFVTKAKALLANDSVKISTIIGYPYGFAVVEAKLAEAVLAMVHGADEIELAVNMTALKNNDWQYLAREINTIMPVVQAKEKKLKILIEASLLTDDELVKCCDLYGIAGVACLSLTTGMCAKVFDEDKVQLVRTHLSGQVGIKMHGIENSPQTLSKPGVARTVIPFVR